MQWIDYGVLVSVFLAAALAFRYVRRHPGGCAGCSKCAGSCASCPGRATEKAEHARFLKKSGQKR